MASVGERLRVLRESRNTSIEEMGVATGIGQSYLEAVERDEIHLLPGRAFGKLYIRAYAEVFGFDPQPWIEDYDREQRAAGGVSTEPTSPVPAGARPVAAAIARWKESRAAAEKAERGERVDDIAEVQDAPVVEVPAPEPEAPVVEPVAPLDVSAQTSASVPAAKRTFAPYAFAAVVAIATALYFGMRGSGGGKSLVPASETPPVVRPVLESPQPAPPTPPPPPVVAEPKPAPPVKAPAVRDPAVSPLTVPESGVGRRIVNSRLDGEASEFVAGTVACFQTRVVGGKRGETIRHVWIYDGRAQQSITLRLGGPDWRTHTNKTLYKTGPWTVEARDGNGRVLATASFACVPAGR
jgi:transcriptional regulator with XRE-family HTH domain